MHTLVAGKIEGNLGAALTTILLKLCQIYALLCPHSNKYLASGCRRNKFNAHVINTNPHVTGIFIIIPTFSTGINDGKISCERMYIPSLWQILSIDLRCSSLQLTSPPHPLSGHIRNASLRLHRRSCLQVPLFRHNRFIHSG